MNQPSTRGERWLALLSNNAAHITAICPSIQVADGELNGETARFVAVVPDAANHYPQATHGEVGLLEGWALAKVLHKTVQEDVALKNKRIIVAIVDTPSQAYGRREEALGIHQALAAAVGAYATARMAGHPLIGLIVGKAMSGAFLAHGYQSNRLIAFNDPEVMIHAMGKAAAARITLRSITALEKLAATIPPMAYDIVNYASLGLLDQLLDIANPDNPDIDALNKVIEALSKAVQETRSELRKHGRFNAKNRSSSLLVRERMRAIW